MDVYAISQDGFDQIKEFERAAFERLIAYCGKKSALADAAGMTRGAITAMSLRGRAGRKLCLSIHNNERIPFTVKDLRADYKLIEKAWKRDGVQFTPSDEVHPPAL